MLSVVLYGQGILDIKDFLLWNEVGKGIKHSVMNGYEKVF